MVNNYNRKSRSSNTPGPSRGRRVAGTGTRSTSPKPTRSARPSSSTPRSGEKTSYKPTGTYPNPGERKSTFGRRPVAGRTERNQNDRPSFQGERPAPKKYGETKRTFSNEERTFKPRIAGSEKSGLLRSRTDRKARSLGKKVEKNQAPDKIRLNRYISNAGICSRRDADRWIAAGMVTVNGKIVTELGTKVFETDDVRFDGQKLNPEKKVYLLLNKPKEYVTTTEDPNADKTVMELIRNACPERIYPVGRLDKNTTGLLLFTNDGELSKRLTHPSHNVKKIYQVTLDKSLTKEDMLRISDGVELEDGLASADTISYINAENKTEIGIEIHSGRNRIVRRIFEHLGYHVRKLDRVYFAGLTKKNIPRGKYRFLSDKEVNFLKMQ